MAIHSQPLLTVRSFSDPGDDDGSSSSGDLRSVACSDRSSSLRRRGSDGDDLLPTHSQMREAAAAPGYVSFEDLLGSAMLGDGSGRTSSEAADIGDPLVRTVSRLRSHHRRQHSPGPLGTRRGSAMHGLVKKYVHPLMGFFAGIFCCALPS